MKVIEGYMDLIIIMVIIVIGMPIITSLIISCNADTMKYLEDKSVIELSDYVEYVEHNGQQIPEYLVPPSTNYAGVIFLPLVQDVFQTDTHNTVLFPGYKWTTNYADSNLLRLEMPFENWEDYTVVRKDKFKDYWKEFISDNHKTRTSLNPGDTLMTTFKRWYYIWNDEIDMWVLTDEINLIYEKGDKR